MRILLVEYDITTLQKIEQHLKEQGHEVLPCHTASEALMRSITEEVDLLICDLHLPDLQGTELVRAIKAGAPHLPVIAMTTDHTEATQQDCEDAGANCLLAKPIDYEKLQEELSFVQMGRLNMRIAIVDTDPIHKNRLVRELEARGSEVRAWSNLSKAISAISAGFHPSLLMIDHTIPHVNELIAWGRHKQFVICVFAPEISADFENDMMRAGVALCMTKPIDSEALLNQIYFLANA